MNVNPSDYVWLVAGGGIIAAGWSHVKSIWVSARSCVMSKFVLDDNIMQGLFPILLEKYPNSRFGDKVIGARVEYVRPVKNSQFVASYLLNQSPLIFWKGMWPLIVTSKGTGYDYKFSIYFIRSTWNMVDLCKQAMDSKNNDLHVKNPNESKFVHRFNIFTKIGKLGKQQLNLGFGKASSPTSDSDMPKAYNDVDYNVSQPLHWKKSDIGYLCEPNPFRAFDVSENIKNAIDDAKKWFKSKDWYEQKEILWRRGWLLYGPPGTGKSKLSSCIAQELDIPIYVFDLATMNNEDFTGFWSEAVGNNPSIVLLEDFDATFKGRTNKIKGGVTFDCILNCIGGVKDSNGIFTIITTNDISNIDPALGVDTKQGSSRPGRMDRVIKLGEMDETCRYSMAKRICSDYPELIDDLVKSSEGYTPAQFQERCTQIALKRYWEEHKNVA